VQGYVTDATSIITEIGERSRKGERGQGERSRKGQRPETYALSAYFRPIVDKLLATTDRADGNQANLRPAAYEALMELIKNSPRDCYETVQHTTVIILERLKTVLIMENQNNAGDRTQFNELQSSLCATLQSVLRKGECEYKIKMVHFIELPRFSEKQHVAFVFVCFSFKTRCT
jgi:hypothetical protein